MEQQEKLNWNGVKAILTPFLFILGQGLILFVAAGNIWLPRAWAFLLIQGVASVFSAVLFMLYMPRLANRRSKAEAGTVRWDRTWLLCYFLVSLVQVPAVAGWNLGRIESELLPEWSFLMGVALYAASFFVLHAAMLYNQFFEGSVRIQQEQSHRVIMEGPYRLIRHPGYVAMTLSSLASPCLLGSPYALVPAGLAVSLLLIRTAAEDRVLQERLMGYSEYVQKVRYRLIPGLW